jgi:hypothetical protein
VEVMQGGNAVDGEDGGTHVFEGDVRSDALEKDERRAAYYFSPMI